MDSGVRNVKNAPKVRQACDCCHARKIKCDGGQPCNKCTVLALPCTYLNVPKKKGPKGPSRRTPKALLKLGIQGHLDSLTASTSSVENFGTSGVSSSSKALSPAISHVGGHELPAIAPQPQLVRQITSEHSQPNSPDDFNPFSSPMHTPQRSSSDSFVPSPQLTLDVALPYINDFFEHKWTITPFIHHNNFRRQLEMFTTSPQIYALVASMCASMIAQLNRGQTPAESPGLLKRASTTVKTDEFFIGEVRRARLHFDYEGSPTIEDVQTSLFLYNASHNRDHYALAFFYVREAITMIELLRLHQEATYGRLEEVQAQMCRRTFWVVFISERILALQQHQNINLRDSIQLPSQLPEDHASPVIWGFIDLIVLWRYIDPAFIDSWNTITQHSSIPVPNEVARYSAIQASLATAVQENPLWSEEQRTDLILTQQWFKIIVWQLCVAKGLISSQSQDESMSFTYPIKVAREVVEKGLHTESWAPHGSGILEKVFDIGCSFVDVLQLNANHRTPNDTSTNVDVGPKKPLVEFLKLCSRVKWGSTRFLPLLQAKVDECNQNESSSYSASQDATPSTHSPMDIQSLLQTDAAHSTGSLDHMVQGWSIDPVPTQAMWDMQAMEEMNENWLRSLSDPSYLDITGAAGWVTSPESQA